MSHYVEAALIKQILNRIHSEIIKHKTRLHFHEVGFYALSFFSTIISELPYIVRANEQHISQKHQIQDLRCFRF